jgi:hypothetical protein
MWIVRVALARPYTFIVLALLILIASPVVVLRTPTDIFPNIDIPVIAVAIAPALHQPLPGRRGQLPAGHHRPDGDPREPA